jgi:hypothetical protein
MSDAVKNETTGETNAFEHFGKTWHAPSALRLSHRESFADEFARTGNGNVAMCRAYLTADEMSALREIDPTDPELDAFTDAMAKALGFENAGN